MIQNTKACVQHRALLSRPISMLSRGSSESIFMKSLGSMLSIYEDIGWSCWSLSAHPPSSRAAPRRADKICLTASSSRIPVRWWYTKKPVAVGLQSCCSSYCDLACSGRIALSPQNECSLYLSRRCQWTWCLVLFLETNNWLQSELTAAAALDVCLTNSRWSAKRSINSVKRCVTSIEWSQCDMTRSRFRTSVTLSALCHCYHRSQIRRSAIDCYGFLSNWPEAHSSTWWSILRPSNLCCCVDACFILSIVAWLTSLWYIDRQTNGFIRW